LKNYSSENWKRHWKEKCYERFLLIKQNENELLDKKFDDPKHRGEKIIHLGNIFQ
jgi:hypothetical protein